MLGLVTNNVICCSSFYCMLWFMLLLVVVHVKHVVVHVVTFCDSCCDLLWFMLLLVVVHVFTFCGSCCDLLWFMLWLVLNHVVTCFDLHCDLQHYVQVPDTVYPILSLMRFNTTVVSDRHNTIPHEIKHFKYYDTPHVIPRWDMVLCLYQNMSDVIPCEVNASEIRVQYSIS